MRYTFFSGLIILSIVACQPKPANEAPTVTYEYFGDSISIESAATDAAVLDSLSVRDSIELTMVSTIQAVCQAKGCWMDVQLGKNLMTVKFWDYGFFVPLDAAGNKVYMEGWAKKTENSVEWLKHKAQDAGAPQDSIDLITEPTFGYDFMATGVVIEKPIAEKK